MEQVTLHQIYPKRTKWLLLLWLLAWSSFLAGLVLPFMTLSKFMFFNNTVSILSGIQDFWVEGEYLLFLIITLFTLVTPLLKLITILLVWFKSLKKRDQYMLWIERYGKWSMLDVFVVAVMIVMVKLDAIASVKAHEGAYLFAFSVVLTMLLSEWVASKLSASKVETNYD